MKLFSAIKQRIIQEQFSPSWVSILISPTYIVRSGLYKAVNTLASRIEGDVLDFGCGSRPYEHLFKNAKTYTGVDIKVSGHNHNNSKIDKFYDGKLLPFPDNSFDCIVSFEVLEHIPNLEEIFKELSRVLKKDGYVLATAPLVWEEHEVPYDFYRYTSFGMSTIFNANNFLIVKSIKSGTHFLSIAQLLINYVSQYILPAKKYWNLLSRLIFISQLNIFFLVLNKILPDSRTLYCSNIILAKNVKNTL